MKFVCILLMMIISFVVNGQKFITSGTIEFEVKTNLHKSLEYQWGGNDGDADFFKNIVATQPQFTLNYYKYNFAENKSTYQFDRNADVKKASPWLTNTNGDDVWFNNYETHQFTNLKGIDDNYLISGALKSIQWKLFPNDITTIAGFNCRRAQTILFDSVYVFAYYTDEIDISGGPMSLNGLPGMILGLTIPRLYTSWIATAVTIGKPEIKQPSKGKKKTEGELLGILNEVAKSRAKEYKNSTRWMGPMIWRTFL